MSIKSIRKNGKVLVEVMKGMHGLKEAGKLAHEDLKAFIKINGYEPTKCSPGLWKSGTSGTTFSPIVDDFGTKCTDIFQAQHLLDTLCLKYEVSNDWKGSLHAGITLDWKHIKRKVRPSVPKCVQKMLEKCRHELKKL